MKRQKKVFSYILLGFALIALTLPFLVTLNDLLARFADHNFIYLWLQRYLVPIEAKMMGVILIFLGYDYAFAPAFSKIIVNGATMKITWNCLGWQSFLLLLITLLVGFGRNYRLLSVLETVMIGILGTFWLNIARMLFTVLLAVHVPPVFRIVFHDYLAAGTAVVWLVVFWWFAYAFVLEEKE